MEKSPFLLLFLFLFLQPSSSQQDYLNNTQLNCFSNPSISKGYLCNTENQAQCHSFLTFKSRPPYNSPISIASLLGSEASGIALANNVSIRDSFSPETLVIVPVSCSCTGSIYQHTAPYTIQNLTESYFTIANNTYQGLTTCQALTGQNYYDPEKLQVGMGLVVPLRCACPTRNQTENGVVSLLMYMVNWGDSVSSIGKLFGAEIGSIMEANRLSDESIILIYPFTPLLVPLTSESCRANPESFFCQCPEGGFNCRRESRKVPVKLVIGLGIGIGVGLLCLVLLGFLLFRVLSKRRKMLKRRRLFEQNGGFLLQQRLASSGASEKAKLFTSEELERATDNFNRSRFLGQGGFGTVYKGMLTDGSIVAVKRSKTIDRTQIEQFINEVVILSQINHRNIVKLLGCCLETEFPLLVYEFIPNGNLSNHIHKEPGSCLLSWETRVRIASEVAEAVAYMHSAATFPIFHRDIKSSNILLNDDFSAKVSDFGTSRTIPFDRTHLTTDVQGTFGYLDPEYFYTSQFTDKSDVYSFGVVLTELLTGEKAVSFGRTEDQRNLVAHFLAVAKDKDHLFRVVDPKVAKEAKRDEIRAIAEIAERCLRLNGKERPTMRQVAVEIHGLRNPESPRFLEVKKDVGSLSVPFVGDQDSTEDCISFSLETESSTFSLLV